MFLSLLFAASSALLGYAVSSAFKFRKSFSEEIAVSCALGLTLATAAAFLAAYAIGALNDGIIFCVSAAAAGSSLWWLGRKKAKFPKPDWNMTPGFAVCTGVFLIISYFLALAFSIGSDGAVYSVANSWGDYPLHFGIITSFAYGNNFPPQYPNLAETPMRYPVLFDFLSSILLVGGFSLQWSVVLPAILFAFAAVVLIRRLFLEVTESDFASSAAILFFFLNGSLSNAGLLADFWNSADKLSFLIRPENFNIPGPLEIPNFINAVIVPQRTVLMGLSLAVLAYFLFYRIYAGMGQKRDYAAAGAITGLLPIVHASSFAVASLGLAFLAVRELFKGNIRKPHKNANFMLLVLPFATLALPQLIWMNEQPRMPAFFGIQPGWLSNANGVYEWGLFWLKNTGVLIPLAIVGLVISNTKKRAAYLPFLAVFAIANLFRLQPWDWDNTKYFMHWLLATAAFAGIAANWMRLKIARASKPVAFAFVAAVLFTATFSGTATLAKWQSTSSQLYSAGDIEIAAKISENTPPGAVIVAAMKHNSAPYSLSGRKTVMGYDGHMWSHGLNYSKARSTVDELFRTGNACAAYPLAQYVYLGPQEQYDYPNAKELLENAGKVRPVFEKTIGQGGYSLFRIDC
ncbi:MAG: hypothetical protein V1708_01620 [Candidatus Micrarchaeota archaeon]